MPKELKRRSHSRHFRSLPWLKLIASTNRLPIPHVVQRVYYNREIYLHFNDDNDHKNDKVLPFLTAYLSGVKGNSGTIGVNAKIKFDECTASEKSSQNHVNSIALAALKAGKSIGLVTTTRGKFIFIFCSKF